MFKLFIATLFFFTFSIHVERTVHYRKRVPDFDTTGMQYRENYESIIARPCQPSAMEWTIADLCLDSFPSVRTNHVKRIICDYGGRQDTTHRFSEFYNDTITVHQSRGDLSRKCWLLDKCGRITDYFEYTDTTEEEFIEKRHFTYDSDGYLVKYTLWYMEDGISKQYRGFTLAERAEFYWSANHDKCEEFLDSKLVSLRGTSRRERKLWDHKTKARARWEFNSNQQPVVFSGVIFDHQSDVNYTYDTKNRIVQRRIAFKDCDGGCVDSFAWIESGGRHFVHHYFSVIKSGRILKYDLLETIGFTYDSKIIYKSVEEGAFGVEQFKHLRGKVYVATYDGDELIREEERDENQNVVVAKEHRYFQHGNHYVQRTDWLETDTTRADTIRSLYKYTDQRSLLIAVDVYNIDRIWWYGTWFFPEYFDVHDKESYRFRYEFYED